MSTREYILSTDAPKHIYIGGHGSLEPFVKFVNGAIEEGLDGDIVAIPFTTENALKLREYLKGMDVEISAKEKAILKYLADHPGSENDEKVIWSIELVDLRNYQVPIPRQRKIKTGWELIHYLPLRYLDKTNPQNITELEPGDWSVIAGNVFKDPEYNAKANFVKIVVEDVKGDRISATFFRQKWLQWQFKKDDPVILYGNYSTYTNRSGRQFPTVTNPKIDKLGTLRGDLDMIPIYPQKQADKSWQLQVAQKDMLDHIVWIEDPVPGPVLKKFNLMSREEAYKRIHFPTSREDIERARERIAFDEFVRMQVVLADRREAFLAQKGTAKHATSWSDQYINSLPFDFTDAQKDAIKNIRDDFGHEYPMYRLLQGDVGTGKTEIASAALLTPIEEGYQAVMLAPTDILATQLYERVKKTFDKARLGNVNIELFNGKVLGKKRKELFERLSSGDIDLLIGTHAVISKGVHFKNLGFAIIDEQHKFSTEQRTRLLESSQDSDRRPDLLMMTATPIPRTQSQVIYGDMDMTIVENQIATRKDIITEWHDNADLAWVRTREEVEKGHQAYVVTAMVSESESEAMADVKAAEATYELLATRVFPDLRVGLLHGKLNKVEKEEVIQAFYEKRLDILVATSVVEVGVNQPNATCMTILNANRFGLAGLHQIRGRVGRGDIQSYCFLVAEATTLEAEERLNVMTETNNGFVIAEKDLDIRGEGSLFSKTQSGGNEMFLATLRGNINMLGPTKRVAIQARKSLALRREVDLLYAGKTIDA